MNQKFFASMAGKCLRTFALLFILFGAAQQLSAQSLVTPTVAADRLKAQSETLSAQINTSKGTVTQIGLLSLRLAYYGIVAENLNSGSTTQQTLDKAALLLVEQYSKLPNTTVTLTQGHVQTVMSETTNILLN